MRVATTPYWTFGNSASAYPNLTRHLRVDAVVVGAGITGVTAAYLLKQAGLTVALVERGRAAQGETSHTTAHLASVTDRPLSELTRTHGLDHARAVWDAGFAAISEVDTIVRRERIECDFEWCPAYLVGSLEGSNDERLRLENEANFTSEAGFDAAFIESIPGLGRPGIQFEHQAKFHPLKYLYGLLAAIPGQGSHVFERSEVTEVLDSPIGVKACGYTIHAGFLVIATHLPIVGNTNMVRATLLQTDLYPYSTYAVRARVPGHRLPTQMVWDVADPYYYLRVDTERGHPFVIFGGADHKTGQSADPQSHYDRVERTLAALLPGAEITHRWSGQVVETRDGLPYIGETTPGQFAATGFSGNGITFATVGAMMARDAAVGLRNPWRDLFNINRTHVVTGLWDYLKENASYPYYMIRDRFAGAEGRSLRRLKRGEGRILELNGRRVAAYRDEEGKAMVLDPACTHMGCDVRWNAAELTWDCPCHGSRFAPTGNVIAGPAETPLSEDDD